MERKTILVVEDDLAIRSSLEELFASEGYPVLLAIHGQAALEILSQKPTPKIGLIFLDLMMPVMNGATFLAELRIKHPEIIAQVPIFLATGGTMTSSLINKTTGFLKKPFDLEELSNIAARYCIV
jgi:CheY-like chemotaxis protein